MPGRRDSSDLEAAVRMPTIRRRVNPSVGGFVSEGGFAP
jgi:hypothetical protein